MNKPWRISLLGGLRVEGSHTTITRFNSQKTAGLLAYLAYSLHCMQAREVLIDLLWSDATPEAGRHSLSVALSTLRHQLEPPGTPTGEVIRADRYSVGLNPAAVTTDVAEFEAVLHAATGASSATERVQLLMRALDLYQDRLLPGFYDEWITAEQDRLSGRFFDATHQLLVILTENGDITTALVYARKAVSRDPLQEEANRSLMGLLASAGQPSSALWQFKEFERKLHEEFGEEPSALLRDFAHRIEQESGLKQPFIVAPSDPSPHLLRPSNPRRPQGGEPFLPGTITFLMTDVEVSPSLRERGGDAFKQGLERQYELLRTELTRSGEQEIKEGSDSCLVAFASARKALDCAVACQTALASSVRHEVIGTCAVRIALDTGDVEVTDGDYHGLVLQQVSRMLTAAHGGQILVSEPTAALVRRHLDGDAVRLVDLGVYQLRDVSGLQRLFQVDYPGMVPAAFPPLTAFAGHPANLPLRFTRFFGREQEIAQLTETLRSPETRLVTVTGSGGTGKTRLSLEVAERMIEQFAGAVYFAPLADIVEASLVPDAILNALRVPRSPGREPLEQVIEALGRKPSLLILDNLEQLIATGGVAIVQTLVSRVPALTVLVTSRQLLGLSAEREFALAPLPLPNGEATPEHLSVFESVQLFIDRAQTVKPDFQVTNHNAAAVAELVSRLEGIPLAIELAAARAQVLTPSQMLAQLEQRFNFLVSRKRDVSERHRTLLAAVEWSYRLLSPELQRLFCRLSVFRGGWTADAAEAVCEEPLALDFLAQLRECSLVLSQETTDGMRFSMLETLREYGREQLTAEMLAFVQWCHMGCFLRLAEEAEPELTGAKQIAWLNRLETEHDNFRAALVWSLREERNQKLGLQLACTLGHFWEMHNHFREGAQRLYEALSSISERTLGRAKALHWAGVMEFHRRDWRAARLLFEESLAVFREVADKQGTANSLLHLGWITRLREPELAHSYFDESIVLFREVGDKQGIAGVMKYQGDKARWAGEYAEARRCYQEMFALFTTAKDPYGVAEASYYLGCIEYELGVNESARSFWDKSLGIFREVGAKRSIADTLHCLAEMAREEGQYEAAHTFGEESLSLFREIEDKSSITHSLHVLGRVAAHLGNYSAAQSRYSESLLFLSEREKNESDKNRGVRAYRSYIAHNLESSASLAAAQSNMRRAGRLWGAAARQREEISSFLPPRERAEYERHITAAHAVHGQAAFAEAWEAGRAMTLEDAIAYALAEESP